MNRIHNPDFTCSYTNWLHQMEELDRMAIEAARAKIQKHVRSHQRAMADQNITPKRRRYHERRVAEHIARLLELGDA
ncbi:hypothetical protein [Paraburkholderia unamae]|uniref:Uncharacterized protein n=1 Tax=Paraburkholderia unamae TaxID=219649 RepID=A0ACC6RGN5_9BURK